jgi:hypothetical protein
VKKTVYTLPWNSGALQGWDICGMNHYHVQGDLRRHLFVSMTRNNRCIKAEGADEAAVFATLQEEAAKLTNEGKDNR